MNNIWAVLSLLPSFFVKGGAFEETSFKDVTASTELTLNDPRISAIDPTGGAVTLTLPDGAYDGYTQTVINATALTTTITVDGNGTMINGSATYPMSVAYAVRVFKYIPATGAQAAQYIVIEGNSASGGAPALHAATHLAGGTDPLLASPGPIGGGTASAIKGTIVTATGGVNLALSAVPTPVASTLALYTGNAKTLGMLDSSGDSLSLQQLATTGTADIVKRFGAVSLADDATLDIPLLGASKGGHGTVTAAAAASSASGSFSYAANAATSANGLTFANFDVADTDTKLCAFASGGNLRIRNRLGSTQTILIELCELLAV